MCQDVRRRPSSTLETQRESNRRTDGQTGPGTNGRIGSTYLQVPTVDPEESGLYPESFRGGLCLCGTTQLRQGHER